MTRIPCPKASQNPNKTTDSSWHCTMSLGRCSSACFEEEVWKCCPYNSDLRPEPKVFVVIREDYFEGKVIENFIWDAITFLDKITNFGKELTDDCIRLAMCQRPCLRRLV